MPTAKTEGSSAPCPVESAMDIIGGRWRAVILYWLLRDGTMRFSDLRRAIPRITQRMLTVDLRALERAGVIARTIYPEVPPRVEYRITPTGRTLKPAVDAITAWGKQYGKEVRPKKA